ncbi:MULTISPECIES: hypothetical protein [unclassified Ruegeria]|uniref:hypothetical protein n=1 Tax=unclassified Ruegeria TaxID=2625375 RepID=UPI0014926BE9|nr:MULTISPECIES: hypothetical protein [unclassified Ruegeria]NOD90497.1 hypothetical protein [Ruegeria sp. HKCCD4318]NOE16457.1 hypothetical protein [Ruegeria sp. HKCCD4318-2]NOG07365.1 hypothetical protein [Ruegeria sp. HKCCD4315]
MGDDDDVELDEQTLRLLRLREAEIAAGRAKLTKPISADEIRARKVAEPKDKTDE